MQFKYNNNLDPDYDFSKYRIVGMRFAFNDKKTEDYIKALQFVFTKQDEQVASCEKNEGLLGFFNILYVICAVEFSLLLIFGCCWNELEKRRLRNMKTEKRYFISEASYDLFEFLDNERQKIMWDSMIVSNIVTLLDLVGAYAFIQDIIDKEKNAEKNEVFLKDPGFIIEILWYSIYAICFSRLIITLSFTREFCCKKKIKAQFDDKEDVQRTFPTHKFQWAYLAYFGYLIDFFANILTAVLGAILFFQYDLKTNEAFLLVIIGSLCAIHVDIYEALRVSYINRPQDD
jgi:hypothetical protein